MKVLVIGSGGREHALCWALRRSPSVTQLFCAPGNPGISRIAEIVPLKVDDINGLTDYALRNGIDLTVVGPEYPLSLGLADRFRKAGLTVFGPMQAAAQLESSKNFAKEIMREAGVPTAGYAFFDNASGLYQHLKSTGLPVVLKIDGLAAGKGVWVCQTKAELDEALGALAGVSSIRVLVEQYLEGEEASFIVATDGTRIVPLASSHDYKRIFDGQQGPNTGGMGAVSPSSHLREGQEEEVIARVIKPVLSAMADRGTPFSGFLYAGLMIGKKGELNVLEFNARCGDPECQAIMRRLDADLGKVLWQLASGASALDEVRWKPESAVCVVLASEGYPGKLTLGDEISGIELAEQIAGSVVFHAGTAHDATGRLVTAGGRVLNVTAVGQTPAEARACAYRCADMIQFRGRQQRRDIGL